jgi:hypothetical protein
MWADYIDPSLRDEALSLVDDELRYTWLTWRGDRLEVADVHRPGNTDSCGRHRQLLRAGAPSDYSYDETLPASSVEDPRRLTAITGDVFMSCSDYPHSEGTAHPVEDYLRIGCAAESAPGLFESNVKFLLR